MFALTLSHDALGSAWGAFWQQPRLNFIIAGVAKRLQALYTVRLISARNCIFCSVKFNANDWFL